MRGHYIDLYTYGQKRYPNLRGQIDGNRRSVNDQSPNAGAACLFLCTGFGHKLISQPTHRKQVLRLGGISFDIAPQTYNEIIDGSRVGIFLQAPDLFQDLFARNGPPAVANEVTQQLGLHQRELEDLLAVAQLKFLEVHGLAGKAELIYRRRYSLVSCLQPVFPPQQPADARNKNIQVERLG